MNKVLTLPLLLLFCACSPYQKYERPLTYSPEEWKNPTPDTCLEEVDHWWDIFHDEKLNELEQMACEKNFSLEEAFQNWQQARALTSISRSFRLPQMSLNPNFTKQKGLVEFYGQNGISGDNSKKSRRTEQNFYSLPLDVSYEVDLWHRLFDNYKVSHYNAEAQEEAYKALILTITSEVAIHYFNLRCLDSELDVLDSSRKIRQEALNLTQCGYQAGLINYTDVSRAETELASVKADIENTLSLRNLEENILATLTAQFASDFTLPSNSLLVLPPTIPLGFPSELLLRRPDIRQAERLMASAHAQIAVEYAAYFPTLTLQSSIGFASTFWRQLFDWKAHFWNIAGNIAQVVFDGGTIQGNVKAAKAAYLQNVAAYQNTVLKAFQEVEDALGDLYFKRQQEMHLIDVIENTKTTLNLSLDRYKQGLVYYLEVVDAERTLLENQRLLIKVRSELYQSSIRLIKAIGGEWNLD